MFFFFSFRGRLGNLPNIGLRPEEILEAPVSSDALRPAWLVGFDGAVWDGAKMDAWSCCWNGTGDHPKKDLGWIRG